VIGHIIAELKTSVSETCSVSIVRVDLESDYMLLIHVASVHEEVYKSVIIFLRLIIFFLCTNPNVVTQLRMHVIIANV
jgi:hypothetical protein